MFVVELESVKKKKTNSSIQIVNGLLFVHKLFHRLALHVHFCFDINVHAFLVP